MSDAQLEKLHGCAVLCSVSTEYGDRCGPVSNSVVDSNSQDFDGLDISLKVPASIMLLRDWEVWVCL